MSKSGTCFISVGENSGDVIAAELVQALRARMPKVQFCGITGPKLAAAQVRSLGTIDSLNVMGIWDVVARIGELKLFESDLLARIDMQRPDVAVLVDFPGMHFRLAEQLKLRGIKVVQYVAPKLWAWGEQRAEKLRRDFDLVLGILPFEQDFFARHEINYQFVGSPHKERLSKIAVSKATLGFSEAKKTVALLPGSRVSELRMIMPSLMRVKNFLQGKIGEKKSLDAIEFVMPLATSITWQEFSDVLLECCGIEAKKIQREKSPSGDMIWRVDGLSIYRGMSLELMAAADAAVVASGTATLECALLNTPMTVVYRMDQSSFEYAKKVVKIPHISLVNLLTGEETVREFVQEFSEHDISEEVDRLLHDVEHRQKQLQALRLMRDHLPGGAAEQAATKIIDLMGWRA